MFIGFPTGNLKIDRLKYNFIFTGMLPNAALFKTRRPDELKPHKFKNNICYVD